VACQAYQQSSSGRSVCVRHVPSSASASRVSPGERGCVGPMGASGPWGRFCHCAPVVGFQASRAASLAMRS
jgi:hypothetical protein